LHSAAIVRREFDLLAFQQLAFTKQVVDAIVLEQTRDTAGQLLNDLVLTGHHLGHVKLDVTHVDAVRCQLVLSRLELM